MPLVGGKRFPPVDGHTAQRSVTVAKSFVALGFKEDVFDGVAKALQFEFVQNIGHHLGTEGLHLRRGLPANQLLEITPFQIAFQGVQAGDA